MSSDSESDDDDFVSPPPRSSKPRLPPPEQDDAGINDSLSEFQSRFNFNSTATVQKSMSSGPSTSLPSSSYQNAQSSSSFMKTRRQKVDKIMDSSKIKNKIVKRKDTTQRKSRTDGWTIECKVPCGFEGCNWYYRSKSRRDDHYWTHYEEKNFQCDECPNKSFKTSKSLRQHKTIVHITTANAVFKCQHPQCGRLFILRTKYRRHLETHLDSRPYLCRICQEGFKTADQLQSHVRKHRDLMPCKYCERLYTAQGVRAHEARHEKRNNFFCELCDADCKSQEDRFNHNQSEGHRSLLLYSELSPVPVTDINLMKDEIIIIPCGPDDYPRWKKCENESCWTCQRAVNAKALIINGHVFEINQTLTCTSTHVLYLWKLKETPKCTNIEKMMRYLGQTNDLKDRMREYEGVKRRKTAMGKRVKETFKKYYEDFELVVLVSTYGDENALNDGEVSFIDVWDCTNDLTLGLNFLRGGKGQYQMWLERITR